MSAPCLSLSRRLRHRGHCSELESEVGASRAAPTTLDPGARLEGSGDQCDATVLSTGAGRQDVAQRVVLPVAAEAARLLSPVTGTALALA